MTVAMILWRVSTWAPKVYAEDVMPVSYTHLGMDDNGDAYNINADEAASAIATALKAEKLAYLSDVEEMCIRDRASISTERCCPNWLSTILLHSHSCVKLLRRLSRLTDEIKTVKHKTSEIPGSYFFILRIL